MASVRGRKRSARGVCWGAAELTATGDAERSLLAAHYDQQLHFHAELMHDSQQLSRVHLIAAEQDSGLNSTGFNISLDLNELDYTGYWHVRRYTGQGTPPTEVDTKEELFTTLKEQPGGIGYLWMPNGSKPKLPDGLKVIRVK